MFKHFAKRLACIALGLSLAPALAQEPKAANPDTEPFSAAEFIAGYPADPARCAAFRTAVWVVVDNKPECVRYFLSGENPTASEALIWMEGDMGRSDQKGKVVPHPFLTSFTPELMVKRAQWLARPKMLGIVLARPGTFGSSGFEPRIRHTVREARIVSAALDAIKERYNLQLLHVAGQSGGGSLTAAMINMRSDVGCAVLASGDGASNERLKDRGITGYSPKQLASFYDASQLVLTARPSDRLRIFVITDPADEYVSARSQAIYVAALQSAGLPVRQIVTMSADPTHHGLESEGRWALSACALRFADVQIWEGVVRVSDKARQLAAAAQSSKVAVNSEPR